MAEHPITPPPELVQQWWDGTHGAFYEFEAVATQAARWGADQELDACCKDILELIAGCYADQVITDWQQFVELLRDGRRPSGATLALDAFDRLQAGNGTDEDWRLVRRHMERTCDD